MSPSVSHDDRRPIRIATVTASDTRTSADDHGGRLLGDLLRAAGFETVSHDIVREEIALLRSAVERLRDAGDADAIVVTGGTGIAPRDITIEALIPLLDKVIEGFGETFRRLSWDDIGPRAMLSRAIAGTSKGRVIIALPGSPKAVRLGVQQMIAPSLEHAVLLASGRHVHHDKAGSA